MTKVLFLSFFLCAVIGCRNSPSNTATKIVADIILPAPLEPFEVYDERLPNGDGLLIHRYHVDSDLYKDIEIQLNKANASKLPFQANLGIDDYIFDYVSKNDKGLYLLTYDPDYEGGSILVVLNFTKMELTILMSYI